MSRLRRILESARQRRVREACTFWTTTLAELQAEAAARAVRGDS